jgi:hypothetical protein
MVRAAGGKEIAKSGHKSKGNQVEDENGAEELARPNDDLKK